MTVIFNLISFTTSPLSICTCYLNFKLSQLISAHSTAYAGLTMMLVLSEELLRSREDLSTAQHTQCKALIHSNVPIVLSTVIGGDLDNQLINHS